MNWDPASANPAVGSFMPGLQWCVDHTVGPILELGGGYFSTPYLHDTGRPVVTYEGYSSEWCAELTTRFAGPDHLIVSEFLAIPCMAWSVILIDHEGWFRQSFFDTLRAQTPAAVFVIHDSQDPWIVDFGDFEYRHDFGENPRTTLLANQLDVTRCDL